MIIVIVCSLGGTAFGATLLMPKFQELQDSNKMIEARKNEIEYRQEYFLKLTETSVKLKEYEMELSKIDTSLPDEPSIPSLFDFLQKTTSQSGMVLNDLGSFAVSPSSQHPGLKEINLRIDVSGPYSSFKTFLSVLEKTARLIDVSGISFSVSAEDQEKSGNVIDFSLSLKTHSY